jgi:hypothetical protein
MLQFAYDFYNRYFEIGAYFERRKALLKCDDGKFFLKTIL